MQTRFVLQPCHLHILIPYLVYNILCSLFPMEQHLSLKTNLIHNNLFVHLISFNLTHTILISIISIIFIIFYSWIKLGSLLSNDMRHLCKFYLWTYESFLFAFSENEWTFFGKRKTKKCKFASGIQLLKIRD